MIYFTIIKCEYGGLTFNDSYLIYLINDQLWLERVVQLLCVILCPLLRSKNLYSLWRFSDGPKNIAVSSVGLDVGWSVFLVNLCISAKLSTTT